MKGAVKLLIVLGFVTGLLFLAVPSLSQGLRIECKEKYEKGETIKLKLYGDAKEIFKLLIKDDKNSVVFSVVDEFNKNGKYTLFLPELEEGAYRITLETRDSKVERIFWVGEVKKKEFPAPEEETKPNETTEKAKKESGERKSKELTEGVKEKFHKSGMRVAVVTTKTFAEDLSLIRAKTEKINKTLKPLFIAPRKHQSITIKSPDFSLSSYETKIKILKREINPFSQKITLAFYNEKNKNKSFVAIAAKDLKNVKAWSLENVSEVREITEERIVEGNQTALYENSVYVKPYFDEDENKTKGDYTIVYEKKNITITKQRRKYKNVTLIAKTKNLLGKLRNKSSEIYWITEYLKRYDVETDYERILEKETLPSNDETVYLFEVPVSKDEWSYVEIETSNTITKFLLLDPASAIWWNTSWKYRQLIEIKNNVNENLSDYQLKIELNETNVGSEFDWSKDREAIRFTYINASNNKEVELNYFIEYWNTSSKKAIVWVNLTFLPSNLTDVGFGNGTARIYMYYGNPYVSNESNGSKVFNFFDDLETWQGWENVESGVVSQDSSYAYQGSYSSVSYTHLTLPTTERV